MGIRKSEFVAEIQFLSEYFEFYKIYVTCLKLRLIVGSIEDILNIQRATPQSGIVGFSQVPKSCKNSNFWKFNALFWRNDMLKYVLQK